MVDAPFQTVFIFMSYFYLGGHTHSFTKQKNVHCKECDAPTMPPNERTDAIGGTHPQCCTTNRHTNLRFAVLAKLGPLCMDIRDMHTHAQIRLNFVMRPYFYVFFTFYILNYALKGQLHGSTVF